MTMPSMPIPFEPPHRALEASWFDVVELMDHFARCNGDPILYFFARLMGDLVNDHDNGDQGCEDCGGGEAAEYCPRWVEGQSHMLGWLFDRAVR